jgi:transposase
MNETLTILSERVDDIPLLLAQMARMGVQPLLDTHFPTHGNWQGLSLGWVTVIWLAHILSQADHRLSHVEPWAEKRLHTLRGCTGQLLHPLDVSDDRLARVLQALSDETRWSPFESALTQQLVRVYALRPERVRLDSTTASGSWAVTPEGIFQFGHSKDHRPDLPQVKVMMSTLDPLGLPLATAVVPGHHADDPLYIPAVKQVRASLGQRGLLYVGDCKMAALETRAFLHAGQDGYLCPLSALQVPAALLDAYLGPIWAGEQDVLPVYRHRTPDQVEQIAEGYEVQEPVTAVVAGEPYTWTERRLVIRSLAQARAGEVALRTRLAQAQTALADLQTRRQGKPRCTELPAVREAAEAILARYRVAGLLRLHYEEHVCERSVRRYGARPATVRVAREVWVSAEVDQAAVTAAVQRLGWRVYATNCHPDHLTLTQAVLAYRSAYLIERGFGRLKGQPLSLTPMYLEREDHVTGLIRLLAVGLRVLTLLEFVVRRRLAAEGGVLAGVYTGQPARATAQPTAERLLATFQEVTLTIIHEGRDTRWHLTPLSPVQQRILALLDLPLAVYTRLGAHCSQPP